MDCDICFSRFDNTRQPKILTRCGHTLCSVCLETIRQSSRLTAISCPHCRLETAPNDVRTNFAILNLLESEKVEPSRALVPCSTHPSNSVSVFCVTCARFICTDCFEVNTAIHASHERIPFDQGIRLLGEDAGRLRERVLALKSLNNDARTAESTRVQEINSYVANIADRAQQHLNLICEELKAELHNLHHQLHTFQTAAGSQLGALESRATTIEKLLSSIPEVHDTQALIAFTQSRLQLAAAIDEVHVSENVTKSFELFSLANPNSAHPSDVLDPCFPNLTCFNLGERRIFSLELPADPRKNAAIPDHEPQRRPIHRSTSNERLSR